MDQIIYKYKTTYPVAIGNIPGEMNREAEDLWEPIHVVMQPNGNIFIVYRRPRAASE